MAVIGDVAGHADELREELVRLGADPGTGRLPPGLVVVQVGDLVHRGPDSPGVVALVDRYLREQPEQWVQLAGNHEAQYLREPVFSWPERLAEESAETLRRWWASGQMTPATAVRTAEGEDVLITHAGLTTGYWQQVLDRVPDAGTAARALNSLVGTHDDVLFAAGEMLGSARPSPLAGPMWAAASSELLPGWLGVLMPFSQVHGHTSMTDWASGRLRVRADLARRTTLDHEAKHETTTLYGGRIVGVDPGHGSQPRRPWRAWETGLG